MRVSTRGDYASRALLSLALHGAETPTSVRDIAVRTALPQPYLEQILLALKGAGLVRSKRGVGGGYVLARPPEEISLAQIVSAVDGPIAAGDFGEPHENGACDHEGHASCSPCGPTWARPSAPTCSPTAWPTWSTRAQGGVAAHGLSRSAAALSPEFQASMAGQSNSQPSTQTAPVRSRNRRPATGGKPSHRAASTRRM